jgi:hypothetical protein
MKNKYLQFIGIAIGLLPLAAYSQEPLYSTIQSATFTLTTTWQEAALVPKDDTGKVINGEDLVEENFYSVESPTKTVETYEYGTKMVTEKISNKEILMYLVEEGAIESIVGYSLSLIYESDSEEEIRFVLTKKGTEPVDISEFLSIVDEELVDMSYVGVATESYKEVITRIGDNETVIETGRGNGKAFAEIELTLPTYGMTAAGRGVASWADTLKSFGKGADQFYAWIDSAGGIKSLAGSVMYTGYYDASQIIEGSISFGAGSLYIPLPR